MILVLEQILAIILGFPCIPAGIESTCNVRDWGSIPGLGRSLGEWKGYPLQYSGLENSMEFHFHILSMEVNEIIQENNMRESNRQSTRVRRRIF